MNKIEKLQKEQVILMIKIVIFLEKLEKGKIKIKVRKRTSHKL
jgi:hypothetical protein